MRKPQCTVSYSNAEHFPKGITWYVTWLPRGYAPTSEDKLILAFPDQGWSDYGLSRGERPPLIEAVCKAIEEFKQAAPSFSED